MRAVLPASTKEITKLDDLVVANEAVIDPFEGLPPFDLKDFEILASPPAYDDTIAPATTLKAPDKRVIWLSVFRNPDNRDKIRSYIMLIDPPVNRPERSEIPRLDYEISPNRLGRLAITRYGKAKPRWVTNGEVQGLISLINESEERDFFAEAERRR